MGLLPTEKTKKKTDNPKNLILFVQKTPKGDD